MKCRDRTVCADGARGLDWRTALPIEHYDFVIPNHFLEPTNGPKPFIQASTTSNDP